MPITTDPPSPGPATSDTATGPTSARARWLVLGVVSLAQIVVVLDATIVNIALPSAQKALGFSNDDRQWVVTAYALAFGSLLLLGGRLGDRLGRKPMFVTGLVGFAAASALGGAAPSFEVLVGARAAQGVFGALLAPAALSLLTVTFTDPTERGRAFAVFGAISGAGGAVGLILGGALTEYLSWRWCLYVNVPLAAVAVVGAVLLLGKEQRPADQPRLDLAGVALSVSGLVALVYGLANAESDGWSSGPTLGFIAAGVVLLALFTWVEARVEHPLLPLRVLLDRTRGGSFVAVGLVGAGMFGVFLFLTYYLSTVLGYQPLETGVSFLPMIVGIVVAAQVAAPVVTRLGVKVPVTVGFATGAVGMFLFTRLGLDSTYWADVFPGLVVLGLGIGLVIAPSISAATAGVDRADAGVASAAVNTFQQIGGSIGTAVLSAVAATAATDYLDGRNPADPLVQAMAGIESYTTAFTWAAGVFALGAVVSALLLPHGALEVDPDAEPVLVH
ncbi:MFS transporter [Nocardioides rubriscoriae]|uniref:MFS transporter n=1 Tax=Nocardioides rubriscoriae TaxID=642762 RepID=UPI0011E027B3|nr:MFS transporter [Nocardioides rubriscoriae]